MKDVFESKCPTITLSREASGDTKLLGAWGEVCLGHQGDDKL